MSTLRTNEVEMLDGRGKGAISFNNVEEMVDSTSIRVGQKVSTLGYFSPGDGGGNVYEVVAASTGTPDGGSYLDLGGSGHQAKGLFPEGVNVRQFGATGDGVSNDSQAIQACFDYAHGQEKVSTVSEGTFLCSGINYYSGQQINFIGTIKNDGLNEIVLRSSFSPGVADPGSGPIVSGCILRNPKVDMDSQGGFGILLECSENSYIEGATFYNAPLSGVTTYTDSDSEQTYRKALIVCKGIFERYGTYYNTIDRPVFKGDTEFHCIGVWLGTTRTRSTQRANFNRVIAPTFVRTTIGVLVELGGDNIIEYPECSINENGIQIGDLDTTGLPDSRRNLIVLPYVESCTNGVRFSQTSGANTVFGVGSQSGTTNVVQDQNPDGYNAYYYTEYGVDFARFYGNELRGIETLRAKDGKGRIEFFGGFPQIYNDGDGHIEIFPEDGTLSEGALAPGADDTQRLGVPSRRWTEVYSATGTINTSDAREKQQVSPLSDAEVATASQLKGMLRKFKWNGSVEKKGDGARWHFGVVAQSVVDVFAQNGLDAHEYGLLCYDEWEENGETVGRYGVRYDQLLAFVLSAL